VYRIGRLIGPIRIVYEGERGEFSFGALSNGCLSRHFGLVVCVIAANDNGVRAAIETQTTIRRPSSTSRVRIGAAMWFPKPGIAAQFFTNNPTNK
jgi:hypothetical protein